MAWGKMLRRLIAANMMMIMLASAPVFAKEKELPTAPFVPQSGQTNEDYTIGPLDSLTVFVWRNPELGASVQVRPDGRITLPLVNEIVAAGRTPAKLSDEIREALGT